MPCSSLYIHLSIGTLHSPFQGLLETFFATRIVQHPWFDFFLCYLITLYIMSLDRLRPKFQQIETRSSSIDSNQHPRKNENISYYSSKT